MGHSSATHHSSFWTVAHVANGCASSLAIPAASICPMHRLSSNWNGCGDQKIEKPLRAGLLLAKHVVAQLHSGQNRFTRWSRPTLLSLFPCLLLRATHLRLPAGGWQRRAACSAPRPATASGWPSPTPRGGRQSPATRPRPPARSGRWERGARRRPGLPAATGRPRLEEKRGAAGQAAALEARSLGRTATQPASSGAQRGFLWGCLRLGLMLTGLKRVSGRQGSAGSDAVSGIRLQAARCCSPPGRAHPPTPPAQGRRPRARHLPRSQRPKAARSRRRGRRSSASSTLTPPYLSGRGRSPPQPPAAGPRPRAPRSARHSAGPAMVQREAAAPGAEPASASGSAPRRPASSMAARRRSRGRPAPGGSSPLAGGTEGGPPLLGVAEAVQAGTGPGARSAVAGAVPKPGSAALKRRRHRRPFAEADVRSAR